MPRRKGPKVTADDWRSDTQRAEDAALTGTWWRCRSHGLTTDPLLLGPSAYCPRDECSEAVLLVHRVSDDKGDARWNDGPKRKPGRPKRVDQVDEDAVEAGPADDAEPEPSDDDGGPGEPETDEPADELVQDDAPAEPAEEEPVVATKRMAADIVLEVLGREGRCTLDEVTAALMAERPDTSRSLASLTLVTLKERGQVHRFKGGTWGLNGVQAEPERAPSTAQVELPHVAELPDARSGRQFVLEFLAGRPGGRATSGEVKAAFQAWRPSAHPASSAAELSKAEKRGLVLRAAPGVYELPHVPAERIVETSAPDSDRPDASSEVAEAGTPCPEQTPTGEHRYPPVPTGNDGSPLAPVVDETNGFPSSPSTGSAERNQVRVRLTGPMRERLEQLRDEGFSGHTVEDVAERFLARALRAFTAAN